jgi:hypothetical protein
VISSVRLASAAGATSGAADGSMAMVGEVRRARALARGIGYVPFGLGSVPEDFFVLSFQA